MLGVEERKDSKEIGAKICTIVCDLMPYPLMSLFERWWDQSTCFGIHGLADWKVVFGVRMVDNGLKWSMESKHTLREDSCSKTQTIDTILLLSI